MRARAVVGSGRVNRGCATDDAAVMPGRHKLDGRDYERMVDAGILGKHDRVELIDGEILDMAPIGQSHGSMVAALNQAVVLACHGRAIVFTQNFLWLDRWNVPQPDFAVFRFRPNFYAEGSHPGPADTLLAVKAADSSLRYDREVKLPLCAGAGIPEYWIVDLQQRVVDVYWRPEGGRYAETATHRGGNQVTLSAAPDIVVTLPAVLR